MMRNRAEFVLSWLAAARLGAVQVPINVDYRGPFLEHLVNTAAADGADRRGRAPRYVDGLGRQARAPPYGRRRRRRAARTPARDPRDRRRSRRSLGHGDDARRGGGRRPSDVGAIHFTSGTSGPSKGAVLPHALLHLLSERNRELLDLRTGDTYLTELPLFHINAQMSVYSALLVGRPRAHRAAVLGVVRGSIACGRATRPTRRCSASCCRSSSSSRPGRRTPTTRSGAPGRCRARPTSRPPSATASGSRRSSRPTGAPRSAWSPGEPSTRRRARSGRSTPTSTRPGSWTSDDEDVPPGEVGELLVRPAAPVDDDRRGTSGCPSARSRRSGTSGSTRGDAARLDADGNLWFVDRIKDRIRRRGENIASVDVENVLLEHPGDRRCGRCRRARPTSRAARTRSRRSSSPHREPRSTRRPSGRGATSRSPTSPSRATSRSCPSCRRPRRRRSARPSCGRPGSRPRRATAAPRAAARRR